MKAFSSKVDVLFAAALVLIPPAPLALAYAGGAPDAALAICGAIAAGFYAFVMLFFIPVRYVFKDDFMEVRLGLILRSKIRYSEIKSVGESQLCLLDRAPVTSSDCVKIELKGGAHPSFILTATNCMMVPKNYILASPKNKRGFIAEITGRAGLH